MSKNGRDPSRAARRGSLPVRPSTFSARIELVGELARRYSIDPVICPPPASSSATAGQSITTLRRRRWPGQPSRRAGLRERHRGPVQSLRASSRRRALSAPGFGHDRPAAFGRPPHFCVLYNRPRVGSARLIHQTDYPPRTTEPGRRRTERREPTSEPRREHMPDALLGALHFEWTRDGITARQSSQKMKIDEIAVPGRSGWLILEAKSLLRT